MILVTFGTISYPFPRLAEWVKFLLDKNIISESVFIQHGTTDISFLKKYSLVTTKEVFSLVEMNELISNSRLIISHGGQGSTRKLAKSNKRFIIVPRLSKYQEHIDDHQLEFVKSIDKKFGVCYSTCLADFCHKVQNPPAPINQELFDGPRLAEHLLNRFPAKDIIAQNNILV